MLGAVLGFPGCPWQSCFAQQGRHEIFHGGCSQYSTAEAPRCIARPALAAGWRPPLPKLRPLRAPGRRALGRRRSQSLFSQPRWTGLSRGSSSLFDLRRWSKRSLAKISSWCCVYLRLSCHLQVQFWRKPFLYHLLKSSNHSWALLDLDFLNSNYNKFLSHVWKQLV